MKLKNVQNDKPRLGNFEGQVMALYMEWAGLGRWDSLAFGGSSIS